MDIYCCEWWRLVTVTVYLGIVYLFLQLFTEYGKLAMESSDVRPFQVKQIIIYYFCIIIL
jgi:hypothetical protein